MLFPTVACGKNSLSKALHIQLKFVSRAVLEMTSRYVNVPVTATPAQLRDALGACSELNPVYRRLLKMALKELQLIDEQIGQLDQEMASLLKKHQDAVQRLAEVPGLGPDSAQQIIAEVGVKAATFASPKNLSSWVGASPGEEGGGGKKKAPRPPKGPPPQGKTPHQ